MTNKLLINTLFIHYISKIVNIGLIYMPNIHNIILINLAHNKFIDFKKFEKYKSFTLYINIIANNLKNRVI